MDAIDDVSQHRGDGYHLELWMQLFRLDGDRIGDYQLVNPVVIV